MHDTVQAVSPGQVSDPEMETEHGSAGLDFEENQLIAMGHKPELKRTHTFWSLMAYQTTILCSWSCNIVMFYYVFTLGGPVSLVWGTYVLKSKSWLNTEAHDRRLIVSIGQLLVMASLAEYCSIWPTAGGQQFYTQVRARNFDRRGKNTDSDQDCGTRKHAKIPVIRRWMVCAGGRDFYKYELCFE